MACKCSFHHLVDQSHASSAADSPVKHVLVFHRGTVHGPHKQAMWIVDCGFHMACLSNTAVTSACLSWPVWYGEPITNGFRLLCHVVWFHLIQLSDNINVIPITISDTSFSWQHMSVILCWVFNGRWMLQMPQTSRKSFNLYYVATGEGGYATGSLPVSCWGRYKMGGSSRTENMPG